MDAGDLERIGAIVPVKPVEVWVDWPYEDPNTGETYKGLTVWVKKHSVGTVERLQLVDPEDQRSRIARYLAETVLLGDAGEQALSYEHAYRFDPMFAEAIAEAARAFNGRSPEKKSRPPRKSGTS